MFDCRHESLYRNDCGEFVRHPRGWLRRAHIGRPVPYQRHHLLPPWRSIFSLCRVHAGSVDGRFLQLVYSWQVSMMSENMTRNGKIARLSKALREELNRCIDNSEQGKSLVKWLNSLPKVQAVMSAEFDGKPIREQNLSEWKKGGYRDWQARQE